MPFSSTNIEPSTNPPVTVTFAGLMLLRPGIGNSLEVGIHKLSRSHSFQVTLIVNKPQRPPRLIRLFSGPLLSNFEMNVDPIPAAGVQKFVATAGNFDRNDPTNNPLDYRWSINMRSLNGHAQVNFNNGAEPIAKLNAGVLYTPNLSRPGLDPILTIGQDEIHLNQIGADLAASIALPHGSQMILTWDDIEGAQRMVLPRNPQVDPPGTTYTISLMNDPPVSDPVTHDELKEYYKTLRIGNNPVPAQQQGRLDAGPHKTDEIPCLPVVLET